MSKYIRIFLENFTGSEISIQKFKNISGTQQPNILSFANPPKSQAIKYELSMFAYTVNYMCLPEATL